MTGAQPFGLFRNGRRCRYDASPEPEMGDATARISSCAGQHRNRSVPPRARAAGAARDRVSPDRRGCHLHAPHRCVPAGPGRDRFRRGPERGRRVSLVGRSARSAAGNGGRPGPPPGGCHRHERPRGTGRQGGGPGDSDRLPDGLRSRPNRLCRQPQQARRQPHGRGLHRHRPSAQAVGAAA